MTLRSFAAGRLRIVDEVHDPANVVGDGLLQLVERGGMREDREPMLSRFLHDCRDQLRRHLRMIVAEHRWS